MKCKVSNLKIPIGTLAMFFLSPLMMSGRDFVHIFTSKGIYETCEDMWFKCLVIDDSTFSLSGKTQTAFVEIVNPSDSIIWKEKYPIVNGECDGHAYVGDNWETGEYRMYINTSGSLGIEDTLMTPKKLLIVRELPEAQKYVADKNGMLLRNVDSVSYGKVRPLNIAVKLDSAEYHTRSKVKARIKVTDSDGNHVRSGVALSVFDRLYGYAPGDLDVVSHCLGVQESGQPSMLQAGESLLPDGPVSGVLMSGKKKNNGSMENMYINVFDYTGSSGSLNVVETGTGGRFEIPVDIATSLGCDILLKPISGKDRKPYIEFDDNFSDIANVREKATDRYYSVVRVKFSEEIIDDTLDYTGRRVVHLDGIEVDGKAGRYPKRNKMLGYLDSISTPYGGAWVCGCEAGNGGTFLNDYEAGYTHHPAWINGYQPKEHTKPIKGKTYEMIKYLPGGDSGRGYVADIRTIQYNEPQYTEEELLKMNGLWKAKGYHNRHEFRGSDEEEMSLGLEDNRNTLLWLPQAATDDNGEMEVEFYTSDITSVFDVIVMAYDSDSFGSGQIKFRITK